MIYLNKMIFNNKMYRAILKNVRKRKLISKSVVKNLEKPIKIDQQITWKMTKEERLKKTNKSWIPDSKNVKKN